MELTALPAAGDVGPDALQLGPADVPAPATTDLGDAFAMHLAEPHAPKPDPHATKPAKPVTAAANDSVVAALMGRPIGKPATAKANATSRPKPTRPQPAASAGDATPNAIVMAATTVTDDPTGAVIDFLEPLAADHAGTADHPHAPTPAVVSGVNVLTFEPVSAITVVPMAEPTPELTPEHASEPMPEPTPKPTPKPAVLRPHTPFVSRAARRPLGANLPKNPAGPAERMPTARAAIPVAPVWPATPGPEASAPHRALAGVAGVIARGGARGVTRDAAAGDGAGSKANAPATVLASAASDARHRSERRRPAAPGLPPTDVLPEAMTQATAAQPADGVARIPARDTTAPHDPAPAARPPGPTGAWWTIPLTFVGIAIVACAILIPAADENRRDLYELVRIERDVDYFERQSAVNEDFLARVNTDATLAERLAQRQLHQTRQGVRLAPIASRPDRFGASPYAMTRLDPPAPLPAYQPMPGQLSAWFLGDKRPQQMAGLGLCLAGAGVLLGGLRKSQAV